jgi:protein PET100
MYILFPIGWMYYFGTNLEERFSVPGFWPSTDQSHKIPESKEEIDQELSRMRILDALKREKMRMQEERRLAASSTVASSAEGSS